MRHLQRHRLARSRILEQDEKEPHARRGHLEGNHFHPDQPQTGTIASILSPSRIDDNILGLRLQCRRPNLREQPLAQHPKEVEAGHPRRGFEIRSRATAKLQHRHRLINDDANGRIPRQEDAVGFPLHIEGVPDGEHDRRRLPAAPYRQLRPVTRSRAAPVWRP